MKIRNILIGIIWTVIVFAMSCDSLNKNGPTCFLITEVLTINIVDVNGEPVNNMELEIINLETGKPLCEGIEDDLRRDECFSTLGELHKPDREPGSYIVVSTWNNAEHNEPGDVKHRDKIEVTGKLNGQELFTQEYIVLMDDSKCHPERLIGPLEIVVELPEG